MLFQTDPANEYPKDHKAAINFSCFGLRKKQKTVEQMNTEKGKLLEEIDDLKAKIEMWEKFASSNEVDEETAKTMDFTGKCIVIFSNSNDAEEAEKRFCHMQYQNCCFDCLHNLFSLFRLGCCCCKCYPRFKNNQDKN